MPASLLVFGQATQVHNVDVTASEPRDGRTVLRGSRPTLAGGVVDRALDRPLGPSLSLTFWDVLLRDNNVVVDRRLGAEG